MVYGRERAIYVEEKRRDDCNCTTHNNCPALADTEFIVEQVVYDEIRGEDQDPLPYLEMDAYDFLRVCANQPNTPIPPEKRLVLVDVKHLRKLVHGLVQKEREQLRLKREGALQTVRSTALPAKRSRQGLTSLSNAKRLNTGKPSV
jgi:hypothetical protein